MKPMLAVAIEDVKLLKYPCYISGKLDGVRVVKLDGKVLTRSLKPLPNNHVRAWLEAVLPDGADGEVIAGGFPGDFQLTSGAVRRETGTPDVQFYWFDWIKPGVPFLERQEAMRTHHATLTDENIIFWESLPCKDAEALLQAEMLLLAKGLEGVMVRNNGLYKYGRSTLNEGILLKLKRFEDAEARIVGFQELLRNNNAAVVNALGHTERSGVRAGLVDGNTLGALLVEDLVSGIAFGIGTGFTAAQRQEIWNARDQWMGKVVKYKRQPTGVKDAPRFPVFLGLREAFDMG